MTLPPDPTPPPGDAQTEPDAPGQFARALMALSKEAAGGGGDARARLARLRRALDRRGVDPLAYREVGHLLADVPDGQRGSYLLVAALYAVHAAKSDAPWKVRTDASFGASCGHLRQSGSTSVDLRFAALLDARRVDLPYRLRQAVALLAANDVGVRYDRLLTDLLTWEAPDRAVQRAWAADYWTPRSS